MADGDELDESRLGATSRRFAHAVFDRFPELRSRARMEEGDEVDGFSLCIEAASPTGDPTRALGLWVEDGGVPSMGYGDWHTHADLFVKVARDGDGLSAMLDLLAAIFADEFVLIISRGGRFDGHMSVLDLREPDALLDELTSADAPGSIKLLSWTGAQDGDVCVQNFETK